MSARPAIRVNVTMPILDPSAAITTLWGVGHHRCGGVCLAGVMVVAPAATLMPSAQTIADPTVMV